MIITEYTNCEVREKTNKMQQLDVYYQHCLDMFRASLCPSSGEQDMCYCTWCAALVLLDVVGRGCGALRCGVLALWRLLFDFTVLAPYNAAPHNRYQPHPAEPTQHTTCSNTRLGLLKMGIMMPETCWDSVDNKHLTVASCWFSLSLHNLLTMHGHRKLKLQNTKFRHKGKYLNSTDSSDNWSSFSFGQICILVHIFRVANTIYNSPCSSLV